VAATATAPVYVSIAGVAKKALPNQPFIVANELICSTLARQLMLPCPPGALMKKDEDIYYFSLDFNIAGQALPPVAAADLIAAVPKLAWGVLVFDVLVMNGDRHNRNIAFDTATGKVQIFDHSHSFLRLDADIETALAAREKTLGIENHCLAPDINTLDGMEDWLERVKLIPDYVVDEIIAAGCDCGIPPDKRQAISDFVKRRRDALEALIKGNMDRFPKLPKVLL
jgi:hypothetical protein